MKENKADIYLRSRLIAKKDIDSSNRDNTITIDANEFVEAIRSIVAHKYGLLVASKLTPDQQEVAPRYVKVIFPVTIFGLMPIVDVEKESKA